MPLRTVIIDIFREARRYFRVTDPPKASSVPFWDGHKPKSKKSIREGLTPEPRGEGGASRVFEGYPPVSLQRGWGKTRFGRTERYRFAAEMKPRFLRASRGSKYALGDAECLYGDHSLSENYRRFQDQF